MGAIGTAILITSYYKLRYHSPLPRQRADFEHLDRSILFEYINTSHCRYRKTIKLRASRPMSVYVDKYKWTGQTTPRVTNSIKGQTFTPTERKSVWQFYEVHFGRTLNKGETVDTDLTFDFEDPQHSFVPFISTNIEEPTRQLKLALRVPLALGVRM